MKITVDDASALPEALQALVQDGEDGAKQLDLTQVMPVEDLSGIKSALQKERANVSAYSKLGTPDEISQRIADLEAQATKGGKSGEEAQAKLDALKADYDKKLADKDERLAKMQQANAAASLKAELAKVGFIPEAIDDIAATALARLQYSEDGSTKVMTADGKPMIGNGPDHGATLADLAKDLAATKSYAVVDGGKGGSGKQPGQGGTPAKSLSEMGDAERMALAKEGKLKAATGQS